MQLSNSLSAKLLVAAGSAITVTLVVFVTAGIWLRARDVQHQVLTLAEERAAGVAHQAEVQITEAVSAGTALAAGLSGVIDAGAVKRADVIALIGAVPSRYPTVFGAWLSDLVDRPLAGALAGGEGLNAAGQFTPYWTKDAAGKIAFSTFDIDATQEWYAGPIKSGVGLISDPYVSSEGKLLTTVTVPVTAKGRAVGLAGVDIQLGDLARTIGALRPFEGGRVLLLSSAATWIVPPAPAELMKDYAGPGAADVRAALTDGRVRVVAGLEDGATRIIYPFTTRGMGKTWAAVVDVPQAIVRDPVLAEVRSGVVGGLLVLLTALGVIFLTTRHFVRRPLDRMLVGITALAERRYDVVLADTERGDEIGAIGRALAQFRDKAVEAEKLAARQSDDQRERVTRAERIERQSLAFDAKVSSLTQAVLDLAGDLSIAAGDLTRGADDTSAKSATVATASGQASANVGAVASAAEELLASIDEIDRRMRHSADIAQSAVGQAGDANAKVDALSTAAQRISEVVRLISDIAAQTNLLALNATIEAARAGEAGRGFAVVASEVKQLASQTASATEEIAVQIQAVQHVTAETVAAIQRISATIAEMNDIARGTQGAVEQQGTATRDIAANIQQASTGTREVSDNVFAVSDAAQATGGTARKVSAAAATLREQAETLRAEVGDFLARVRDVG
jgi:methyl-accepting chemotaxis protein